MHLNVLLKYSENYSNFYRIEKKFLDFLVKQHSYNQYSEKTAQHQSLVKYFHAIIKYNTL